MILMHKLVFKNNRTFVYRILSSEGIKSPKKHHKHKEHHRRKRKPQRGMMVQIDVSPHTWFIGEEMFHLHGALITRLARLDQDNIPDLRCLDTCYLTLTL